MQVAEVTEQRQGLLLAGGGGRVVPGQLLQQAQAAEGPPGRAVAERAGQRQGLLVAGGGGRVVPGQHPQEAQLVEGVGLAGLVTGLTVERQRPGQGGGGGRVVSGLPLQCAQLGERVGLAEPVASPARRGQGTVVEGGGLVPVTAGGQEAADRGGDGEGVREPCAPGGVVRRGVQVRPVGFQPGGRLPESGQVRGRGRRLAGREAAVGAGPGAEVPPGGQGGVQVVVQQPAGRGV